MGHLSAQDIVTIWETCSDMHPVDRVLAILAVAMPGVKRERLARIPIGQRDRLLLNVRERTFGPLLRCFAACPECSEHLEIKVSTTQLRVGPSADFDIEKNSEEVEVGEIEIRFRLPNSIDLATAVRCEDLASASRTVAQRCILGATEGGKPVEPENLSRDVLRRLGERMAECDPGAEIYLDLECPTCGHRWQMPFDIADFFWKEISADARRLLREVHVLAAAYKWREREILSMSPLRRQHYLEMAT